MLSQYVQDKMSKQFSDFFSRLIFLCSAFCAQSDRRCLGSAVARRLLLGHVCVGGGVAARARRGCFGRQEALSV